jgi:hypothetical protein
VGSAGAGVVTVKVHAVFFAITLKKLVVMVSEERVEYGELQTYHCGEKSGP